MIFKNRQAVSVILGLALIDQSFENAGTGVRNLERYNACASADCSFNPGCNMMFVNT